MPVYQINPSQMAKSVAALQALAGKQWLPELAMQVSVGGMKFVADEFNTSTDPYGKPWVPLKNPRPRDVRAARRNRARAARAGGGMGGIGSTYGITAMMMPALMRAHRGPKVLVDTARMKGSVGASPSGRTAKVVVSTWYAAVHQDGATIAPHTRLRAKVLKHRARVQPLGFQTYSSIKRATYANGITIPQRMILPDDKRGLPPAWNTMVRETAEAMLARKFGP